MKALHTLAFAMLGAGSALALHAAVELSWHVSEGTTLRRELITKQFLATESVTFKEGDQTTVSQRLFDLQTTTTVRTSDRIYSAADGRPTSLRRFYDETRVNIVAEVSAGKSQTRDFDTVGSGAFQGKSVLFTWVPEDQAYGRYYDGLEGREEALVGLYEDLGARALMPSGSVVEGDEWVLPVCVLRDLFAPGGDLAYDFSKSKDPLIARTLSQGVGANFFRAFGGEEVGEVKAKWARTEQVEGRSLAVISLEFKAQLSRDLRELADSMRAVNEINAGQENSVAELAVELEGAGEVRWDLAAGCMFDTAGLRADQKVTFTKIVDMNTGDGTVRTEQVLKMTGAITQESRVTIEP